MSGVCRYHSCLRPAKVRGFCRPHYVAAYQRDKTLAKLTSADRFWAKVDRNGPDGCWLWTGTMAGGYGQVQVARVKQPAHRWAYQHLVGPIPVGLVLDHLCRNQLCVNPTHLEPVTVAENIRRGRAPSVAFGIATHCKHGHEFAPENTIVRGYSSDGTPHRRCRVCRNRDALATYHRTRNRRAA